MEKLRVLFICNQNSCRSKTAEWLYEKNEDIIVSSAGINENANVKLTEDMLIDQDIIYVFEYHQKNFIKKQFPKIYKNIASQIQCLEIKDNYRFQDPDLIEKLVSQLTNILGRPNRSIRDYGA